MADRYTFGSGEHARVMLSGGDAYALRCAYLHEGNEDIVSQRARRAISSFVFVAVPDGRMVHCNQSNDVLQLQIDVFCRDICQAVEFWAEGHLNELAALDTLLHIRDLTQPGSQLVF